MRVTPRYYKLRRRERLWAHPSCRRHQAITRPGFALLLHLSQWYPGWAARRAACHKCSRTDQDTRRLLIAETIDPFEPAPQSSQLQSEKGYDYENFPELPDTRDDTDFLHLRSTALNT